MKHNTLRRRVPMAIASLALFAVAACTQGGGATTPPSVPAASSAPSDSTAPASSPMASSPAAPSASPSGGKGSY
jgi:hypothetical protein